jgi:hypothetical protein
LVAAPAAGGLAVGASRPGRVLQVWTPGGAWCCADALQVATLKLHPELTMANSKQYLSVHAMRAISYNSEQNQWSPGCASILRIY